MTTSNDALLRLAHKYATLGELRRARADGEPLPPREVFKRLADEFPGCLNELDTLPLEEIDERARRLRETAAGGAPEPWMAWLSAYHATLRAALWVRIRTVGKAKRALDEGRVRALAEGASLHARIEVDEAFVRATTRPPGGRLNNLVFEQLENRFGEPAATIKFAIFPRARASRSYAG